MGNVVYKLTSKEIQSLMAQTTFETKVTQGMARTRYQNTVINIYSSVMFQVRMLINLRVNCYQINNQQLANIHHQIQLVIQYNRFHCIGSDEAGSGDYFGPLTVCAYVSQSHIKILKELGVDDSKN